jgi:hypothetical protein
VFFFSRLLAIYGYFQKGMTKTNSSYSEEEEEEKRMYRLTAIFIAVTIKIACCVRDFGFTVFDVLHCFYFS